MKPEIVAYAFSMLLIHANVSDILKTHSFSLLYSRLYGFSDTAWENSQNSDFMLFKTLYIYGVLKGAKVAQYLIWFINKSIW